jgi:PAS domain S-box-containing protein
MYGWTAMDVLGHPMREFIRNEYPFDSLEIVTEQLLEKGHWKGEVTQNRRDGTRFPAFSSVSALKDHTDKVIGFVAVNRDITERKRLEEALAHEREELARSNAELEQFAYVASHDLQEPLRMVSSYVQLLARRYQGKLDRDAEEFIGFAADGAARMQQMIVDLLALSRLGTHGQQFAAVPCDGALDQALANLQTAIQDSKAKIKRDPLPTVMADHAQLVQLFQNLIGNALKFRGKRAPRVHISAELHAEAWVFSVRDNGIGIDPAYAERVFVLFQRLHGRSEYAGTGIGLAICKKTVGQHGGRIWVESRLKQGSTFYFSLPISMSSHKGGDPR